MADKKKKQPKKPDGHGKRPKDPNQLAFWIVQQSTNATDRTRDERANKGA